jgi:predicted ABC-type ATPase
VADLTLAVAESLFRSHGGEGSGNFGHEGRPGEVGGSGPGDITASENVAGRQIERQGKLVPGGKPRGINYKLHVDGKFIGSIVTVVHKGGGAHRGDQISYSEWQASGHSGLALASFESRQKAEQFLIDRAVRFGDLKTNADLTAAVAEAHGLAPYQTGVHEDERHLRTHYDPDQPRDPAGTSTGGQWTGGDSSILGQPASAYPPQFAAGRDTRERFSDGQGHYTPERAALHRAIVEKYLAGTTAVDHPTVVILGGGGGSGKSTFAATEGIGKTNTVQINTDLIRAELPETVLGDPMGGVLTHEEASDISGQLLKGALAGRRHAVLDGTGDSTLTKLGGKVAVMRAAGYEIVAEYVTVPIDVAQARADARGARTGRYVPQTALRHAHEAVSRIFPEAIRQGLFDRARLWDTNTPKGVTPRLVASSAGTKLSVHDPDLWKEFLSKGHP